MSETCSDFDIEIGNLYEKYPSGGDIRHVEFVKDIWRTIEVHPFYHQVNKIPDDVKNVYQNWMML